MRLTEMIKLINDGEEIRLLIDLEFAPYAGLGLANVG